MNVQFTDKIECIFKNTLILIREKGFHGTPMSQIAKSSDVAIGTIYHYFPSKEKLILELAKYCKQKVNVYIFENLNPTDSYKMQFNEVFRRFCAFQINSADIFCFLEQFYNSPFNELAHKLEAESSEEHNIKSFLKRGIDTKALKNIDINLISASVIGTSTFFSKAVVRENAPLSENNLDELIDIIWNGVKLDDTYEN